MIPNKTATTQQQITSAGVLVGALLVVVVACMYPEKVFHHSGMFLQGPRKGRGRKR